MTNNGVVVAIEGLEGSGKSTALANARQLLSDRGFSVAVVEEFSESMLGAYLGRRLEGDKFLRDPLVPQTAWTQIYAVAADTAYSLEYTIPALAANHDVVLKDRYRESMVACQHVALVDEYGMTVDQSYRILSRMASLLPDPAHVLIWLSASEQDRWARLKTRNDFAPEDERVLRQRDRCYSWLMQSDEWSWRARTVNGSRTEQDVAGEILDIVVALLES